MDRSFSVNKDVSEHNLVARRIAKYHIHRVGRLRGVVSTKELLNSAQCGRQRYHAYLEKMKTEKEKNDKIKFLYKEADRLSLKAEETRNLNLIIKCNSKRKRSKHKEAEVEQLKTEIAEKETNVL